MINYHTCTPYIPTPTHAPCMQLSHNIREHISCLIPVSTDRKVHIFCSYGQIKPAPSYRLSKKVTLSCGLNRTYPILPNMDINFSQAHHTHKMALINLGIQGGNVIDFASRSGSVNYRNTIFYIFCIAPTNKSGHS